MLYRTMKERTLDDEFGIEDIEFEINFRDFEHNRMYPLMYRKESPMTEVVKFAKKLRELSSEAPVIVLEMPSDKSGLPEGQFFPETLLLYIAHCFDGKSK